MSPSPASDSWHRTWIGLALLPLLLLSLYHFAYGVDRSHRNGHVDFPIFVNQAHAYLQTGVLYPDAADPEVWGPAAAVYKYPPFYAIWLLPFVKDGVRPGLYTGMWLAMVALYAASYLLAVYMLGGRRRGTTAVLFGLMALNFEPFMENLWHLQLETPFVLLLLLALLALRRRHDEAAGAIVGWCASLKIYPAFLLLWFALRARYRAVAGALVTALLAVVASLVVIGLPAHVDYFGRILPVLLGEQPSLLSTNQGLARYVHDVLGASLPASKRIGQLLAFVALVLSVLCLRRNRGRANDAERTALEFSMFVGLMILWMPNFWSHYQVLLLLPFFVVTHRLVESADQRWLVGPLLGVAYGLTLFYSPCAPLDAGYPCAQTPYLLGLFRLPRDVHDALVYLKVIPNVVAWLAPFILSWNWERSSGSSRLASDGQHGTAPG
jgi:hypothetical protein